VAGGFTRILMPTDFSSGSEQAWAVARQLADGSGQRSCFFMFLVEAPLFSEGPFTMKHAGDVFEAARAWSRNARGAGWPQGTASGLQARWIVRTGVPHKEIVAAAAQERADVVVLGTQGRGGIDRALLGSVADRVIRLRRVPC